MEYRCRVDLTLDIAEECNNVNDMWLQFKHSVVNSSHWVEVMTRSLLSWSVYLSAELCV